MSIAQAKTHLIQSAECQHCGSKFAAKPNRANDYCCAGCEQVAGILRSSGLENYYSLLKLDPPACPLPAQVSTESFDLLDDPQTLERIGYKQDTVEFFLEGLNCTACLWLIEKLPSICSDAVSARVDMSRSIVRVEKTPSGSFATIAKALSRLGHRPSLVDNRKSATDLSRLEERRELIRIGITASATANLMLMAVSLYGGAEGFLADHFRWIGAALATPVLTYGAWPFYRSAFGALRAKAINLDVPIVAAILGGAFFSIYGLFAGVDTLYFDSVSMLVVLLLSSRYWLKTMQKRHLDLSHLENEILLGSIDRATTDGKIERVSTLSLEVGDRVVINAETTVPADGRIIGGSGEIQTAALTGESRPLIARVGDAIEAGTRGVSGSLLVEIQKKPSESRIAYILRDAELSAQSRPNLLKFHDRVGQIFVAVVLLLAVATLIIIGQSNMPDAASRAVALVIVTCPCVFGMAIPLSMSLAIKAAARKGIVIKNPEAVEKLFNLTDIYFDKTGTLSVGQMKVVKIDFVNATDQDLVYAAVLEKDQVHPVAAAIRESIEDLYSPALELFSKSIQFENVSMRETGGIEGRIDDTTFAILPFGASAGVQDSSNRFVSRYGFYKNKSLLAEFHIGDSLKPESRSVIEAMKKRGLNVHILSGDRKSIVDACAKKLAIESVISECTPEKKAMILESHAGSAAMVGDGANDAGALASAGVGIAIRGSLEASLKAADVYLVRSNLDAIGDLFAIADETRKAIRRNLVFSATFNVIAGALAIAGLMAPLWAAIFMPLSSLTVLISSLATERKFPKGHS